MCFSAYVAMRLFAAIGRRTCDVSPSMERTNFGGDDQNPENETSPNSGAGSLEKTTDDPSVPGGNGPGST